MHHAVCTWSLQIELINTVGRLAGAHTLLWRTQGALSIIHTLAVAGPELCDLIGILKFLGRYTPDVHESPDRDPLSLFQTNAQCKIITVYS